MSQTPLKGGNGECILRRFLRELAVKTKSVLVWAGGFAALASVACGVCWVSKDFFQIPYNYTAPAIILPVVLFVFLFPVVEMFDDGWRVLHFVLGFWVLGLICSIGRWILHVDSPFLMGVAGGVLGFMGFFVYLAMTDTDVVGFDDRKNFQAIALVLLLMAVGVLCGLSTFTEGTYGSDWILGGIAATAILGAYTGFIHAPKLEEPQTVPKLNEMLPLNDLSQAQLQSILDMLRTQPDSSQRRSLENEISKALASNRRRR